MLFLSAGESVTPFLRALASCTATGAPAISRTAATGRSLSDAGTKPACWPADSSKDASTLANRVTPEPSSPVAAEPLIAAMTLKPTASASATFERTSNIPTLLA